MAKPPSKRLRMEEVEDGTRSPSDINGCEITELREIDVDSEDFSEIVKSGAFIDKTLLISMLFKKPIYQGMMKKVLITAPHRFGKSVNMNMLHRFFEIEVDEKGEPMNSIKRNETGKWIEDDGKSPTKNFKLFKGNNLKIYQCQCNAKHTEEEMNSGLCASRQFFYEHCGQHPVIFVSLKELNCDTWEKLINTFRYVLNTSFKEHTYLGKVATSRLSDNERRHFNAYCDIYTLETLSEEKVQAGLRFLAEYLHTQFNKKSIILIDEFDAPIMKLIHSSRAVELSYIEEVIKFIREIVSSVMKGNKHVLGGLINACVLLSTVLSSDANNIEICPFLEKPKFAEFYGFTEDELNTLLQKPQFKGFDEKAVLYYYSGYQVLKSGLKMYNVFSIVMYLENWTDERASHKNKFGQSPDKKDYKPESYWVENHGIKALEELFGNESIRKKIYDSINDPTGIITIEQPVNKLTPKHIRALNKLITNSVSQYASADVVDLFFLYLKDRGYFNLIKKEKDCYSLQIPNGEIKDEFMKKFYNVNYLKEKYKFNSKLITEYCNALDCLDGNKVESFQNFANSIAHLISGVELKNHDEFKRILFTFAKNNKQLVTHSEIFCNPKRKFRVDWLMCRKDGTGILVEVRWGPRETACNGLKQIFDRECYKIFEDYSVSKQKIYISLHFSEQKLVTVYALTTDANKVIEKWDDIDLKNFINITSQSL